MTHDAAPSSDVPVLGTDDAEFVLDPATLEVVAATWDRLDSLVPFPGNPKVHTDSAPEVGDLVYEPFMGSGSQLIAAAQAGRRCFGMELSRGFCDAIRRRWTAYAKSAGIDAGPGALE